MRFGEKGGAGNFILASFPIALFCALFSGWGACVTSLLIMWFIAYKSHIIYLRSRGEYLYPDEREKVEKELEKIKIEEFNRSIERFGLSKAIWMTDKEKEQYLYKKRKENIELIRNKIKTDNCATYNYAIFKLTQEKKLQNFHSKNGIPYERLYNPENIDEYVDAQYPEIKELQKEIDPVIRQRVLDCAERKKEKIKEGYKEEEYWSV